MSMRALLKAVEARIRSAVSLSDDECAIRPDGKPPAACGQLFVAVHPGDVASDSDLSLDERVSLNVTVTLRCGYSPDDRLGAAVIALATEGLFATCERIRAAAHMDYTAMNDANANTEYGIGAADNGFVEPLKFRSLSYLGVRDGNWFWGEPEDDQTPVGLAAQMSFGGARRVQVIEEQD